MKEKYWYGMSPDVYIQLCGNRSLAYDTKQKKCHISDDKDVSLLLSLIEADDSLGCVLVDETWQKETVENWIEKTCKEGMARTFPYEEGENRPVILRPLLSLNKDFDKVKNENDQRLLFGRNIKHYLNSLTIYMNAGCSRLCAKCKDYYKQMTFCTNYDCNGTHNMTPRQLEDFLVEVASFPIAAINVFGGCIYDKERLHVLESTYMNTSLKFRFYVYYQDYHENSFVDSQEVHILVPEDFDCGCLAMVCNNTAASRMVIHFVIENYESLQNAMGFIDENAVQHYQIHPFYTGNNSSFFEKYVFMTEDDIMQSNLSMREIFRNKKLNANFFGALYLMPDGDIKAHVAGTTIGRAGHDELVDIIFNELVSNTSWRRIRDKKPCSHCVYQFLCPPVSNYEMAMGKENLCHIKQQQNNV